MVSYKNMPEGNFKLLMKSDFQPLFRYDYVEMERFFMPAFIKAYGDDIRSFRIRDDDVFVCSFPKSGTTWTQEMVWCIGNNLDFEKAKIIKLNKRFPQLEVCGLLDYDVCNESTYDFTNSLEYCKNLKGQRFIKTHLSVDLCPRQLLSEECKAKIVYVARDPRDVVISYYHHYQVVHGYTGSFDDFLELFVHDKVIFCPYWKQVLGFWNIRKRPNVLFITYEKMKKDLPSVIRKVAEFLGKPVTPEQMEQLADHLSFKSMKENPSVNSAQTIKEAITAHTENKQVDTNQVRKGESGAFQKNLTEDQLELLNEWCKKNLAGSDYKLSF